MLCAAVNLIGKCMNTSTTPERIIFLARNESSVRTDTATLRALGVNSIVFVTDAAKAVAALAELQKRRPHLANAILPNLIVCDEYVGNTHIFNFLHSLGQHGALQCLPILVLASAPQTVTALQSIGIAALIRPYTQETLTKSIAQANAAFAQEVQWQALASLKKKLHSPASGATKRQPTAMLTTSDWCNKGIKHYQQGELSLAAQAFKAAIARQEDHVDANLGLACIYNKQNNTEKMNYRLLIAAAGATRQGLHAKAEAIMEKLPQKYQHGCIFTHEATQHLQTEEYQSAALSFLDAARTQKETPLHSIIARSSHFTPNPEQTLRELCVAYERMGHTTTAKGLRKRLLNGTVNTLQQPTASWLDNFPIVRDVLHVASFTAHAWKQA